MTFTFVLLLVTKSEYFHYTIWCFVSGLYLGIPFAPVFLGQSYFYGVERSLSQQPAKFGSGCQMFLGFQVIITVCF